MHLSEFTVGQLLNAFPPLGSYYPENLDYSRKAPQRNRLPNFPTNWISVRSLGSPTGRRYSTLRCSHALGGADAL